MTRPRLQRRNFQRHTSVNSSTTLIRTLRQVDQTAFMTGLTIMVIFGSSHTRLVHAHRRNRTPHLARQRTRQGLIQQHRMGRPHTIQGRVRLGPFNVRQRTSRNNTITTRRRPHKQMAKIFRHRRTTKPSRRSTGRIRHLLHTITRRRIFILAVSPAKGHSIPNGHVTRHQRTFKRTMRAFKTNSLPRHVQHTTTPIILQGLTFTNNTTSGIMSRQALRHQIARRRQRITPKLSSLTTDRFQVTLLTLSFHQPHISMDTFTNSTDRRIFMNRLQMNIKGDLTQGTRLFHRRATQQ